MKKRYIPFLVIAALVIVYLLGPVMPKPVLDNTLPKVPVSLDSVAWYVNKKESSVKTKPDNEARIIWANDSVHQKTDYVLLYLPGFSASYYEGYPVNADFAKRYGCNAYFARLAGHGLVTKEPLLDMTPDNLYETAKEALVIASRLGKKVIIMSTSTGGTLSLMLDANFPEMIDALVLYSPNIKIRQKSASLILSKPWGLQIARLVYGGKYRVTGDDPNSKIGQYWYTSYRAEATVYLQQLLDAGMKKSTFAKVKCPVFLGYYYKDEEHQDPTVDVGAELKMFSEIGTSSGEKVKKAFPEAGVHTIACKLTSGAVPQVEQATWHFADDVLHMTPVHP